MYKHIWPLAVEVTALLPSLPDLEQIQRKSRRVREWTLQNAPRIRVGVEKKDQKAELKKNQTRRCYAEKTSIFFSDDRQTPARLAGVAASTDARFNEQRLAPEPERTSPSGELVADAQGCTSQSRPCGPSTARARTCQPRGG